jgi:hypothetical protein
MFKVLLFYWELRYICIMNNLDINTPKGRKSVEDETKMINYIKSAWDIDIIEAKKSGDGAISAVDGLLVKNNELVGIFETKCRYDKTYAEFETDYGSWLITNDKIIKGKTLSELLRVPFIGFLYIVKSNITLYWKITNDKGEYLFDFTVEKTATQKTINGGLIERENAFLDLKYSKFVQKQI